MSPNFQSTYRLSDDVLELVSHRVNHVHFLLRDLDLVLGQKTIRFLQYALVTKLESKVRKQVNGKFTDQ